LGDFPNQDFESFRRNIGHTSCLSVIRSIGITSSVKSNGRVRRSPRHSAALRLISWIAPAWSPTRRSGCARRRPDRTSCRSGSRRSLPYPRSGRRYTVSQSHVSLIRKAVEILCLGVA
jgi:hypothetical protein